MSAKTLTLTVTGPQDFTDQYGNIESHGYGVISTDGTECWDVEYPFATEEEAAARMLEIEAEMPEAKG